MDPKLPTGMLLAPASSGARVAVPVPKPGAVVQFPARVPFPAVDEHLVSPEITRDEVIRGRRAIAMPSLPPHADRHCEIDYVIRGNVKPGYVGATELITRVAGGSDFATDTCVRKEGEDPATGARYLEELAFEVVNEQSPRDVREKAEDLTTRGVRRVFAIFVKTGRVCEWSRENAAWRALDPEGAIEDTCLQRPLRVAALLDAAAADDAVAQALVDKQNPVIEGLKARTFAEGESGGKAAAILAVLSARGIAVSDAARARILGSRQGSELDRWIARAAVAGSIDEVLAGEA